MPNNPVLEEMISTGLVRLPDSSTTRLNAQIDRAEGKLIQDILIELRPIKSLEVGCHYGISSHYICDILQLTGAQEHHIIDSGQRAGVSSIGMLNLLLAGYGNLIIPIMIDLNPSFQHLQTKD